MNLIPKVNVGVTGTRSGMTDYQKQEFKSHLENIVRLKHRVALRHGDCVGVDVEAAEIAIELGCWVICHPPEKNDLRAYHASHSFRTPKSYFARNRDIVEWSDLLFVIPYQMSWSNRGGTWYTHDYAIKQGTSVIVLCPEPKEFMK